MSQLHRFALLPFLLAAAPPAAAQEARSLSLAEAIAIAEERNPAFQVALAEIEAAEAGVRAAWGGYLPELSLGLSTGASVARRATGQDPFGRPTRLDDPLVVRSSSASQSLRLSSITLFDGGQRRHQLGAARAGSRAATARVAAERLRLGAEVARRYREAQRAERLLDLEREALRLAGERLEIALRLLRLTLNDPLDVAGAELALAEREQAVERARGAVRTAQLALREAMGWMDGAPLRLTEPLPEPFDPAELDTGALVARALESAPAIVRQQEELTALELEERSVRAARWPRVTTFASLGRSLYASEYHALFDPNPLDQALSVGFDLQLPLFNQFRTSANLARARAQQGRGQHELAAARLTAEREVRGALVELENAFHADRLALRVEQLHRQRTEMAEERYRLGGIDFREFQEVIERAHDAARGLLDARFDFARALIALDERSGGPAR
jgi:outer membrane protein TolC